ncbi:MAG: conjugal transfer protein TraE, partial [Klebsiella quasipneumoniae]|nr:conjugal transfer protein TraE [Klebsiella quasipneumoniae]
MFKKQKQPPKADTKLSGRKRRRVAAAIGREKGDGKPRTAQQSIPYLAMYPDGICRVTAKTYSKCIEFLDINYQLAGNDEKTAIFEYLCDFYNYFDSSISVQLSFINRRAPQGEQQTNIDIPLTGDDFDYIRKEYRDMLGAQLEKGNNGIVKTKYITVSIDADNPKMARARLGRIETDILNNFKVMGASARPLNGVERLQVMHSVFHPDGEPFNFSFDWLAKTGLSTKDY